jgi:hypothetical protein
MTGTGNHLTRFEGYWASLIYSLFASQGFDIIAEDSTNSGQIDLTVKTPSYIWIFEFKVKDTQRKRTVLPLTQMEVKKICGKISVCPRKIIKTGIIFDPKNEILMNG